MSGEGPLDPSEYVRAETDAAVFENGRTTLKGNPLKTVKEILCPNCHLPRLLYPTDGVGAREPDPTITYCKKTPFIQKEGYDIYGQTWIPLGPGRGKKKKTVDDFGNPLPTFDGPRPPNVLSYPSATCIKCKRCILVTRLNNHMASCIGNSGRNASRAAAQKISGNGDGQTPPSSQKGTPMPVSRPGSPRKRDGDEFDKDSIEASPVGPPRIGRPPKKKQKKSEGDGDAEAEAATAGSAASTGSATPAQTPSTPVMTKKVVLKTKGAIVGLKKDKPAVGSLLKVESKPDGSSEESDEKPAGDAASSVKKKGLLKTTPSKPLRLGSPAKGESTTPITVATPVTVKGTPSLNRATPPTPAKKGAVTPNSTTPTPARPPPSAMDKSGAPPPKKLKTTIATKLGNGTPLSKGDRDKKVFKKEPVKVKEPSPKKEPEPDGAESVSSGGLSTPP